jgi:plastocyanin/elongation factor P hydroxylase
MKTKTRIIHPAFALFAFACFAFLSGLSAASAATFNVRVGVGDPPRFVPSSVTIHPGDRVKWTWASSGHTVTSGPPGIWDSGIRGQGATFNHTFNTEGTFWYYCTQQDIVPPYQNIEAGQVIVMSVSPDDFNHDGKPDYVVYNAGTQQTAVWFLNYYNVYIGGASAPTLPAGWIVVSTADFNRDDHPDYALFNANTRQTAIWYLSGVYGVTFIGSAFGPTPPGGWELVATADFNNDLKPDYVLYNATTHQTVVWYLNNNVRVGAAVGPTLPGGWSVAGVADFNGDGKPDYLLFNSSTRQTVIWYLSGITRIGSAVGPTPPGGWSLVGAADFNRDGKPDYLLFNPSTRQTVLWYMNNNVRIASTVGPTLLAGWTVAAP